jgi:hypothetical protein
VKGAGYPAPDLSDNPFDVQVVAGCIKLDRDGLRTTISPEPAMFTLERGL